MKGAPHPGFLGRTTETGQAFDKTTEPAQCCYFCQVMMGYKVPLHIAARLLRILSFAITLAHRKGLEVATHGGYDYSNPSIPPIHPPCRIWRVRLREPLHTSRVSRRRQRLWRLRMRWQGRREGRAGGVRVVRHGGLLLRLAAALRRSGILRCSTHFLEGL
jgi:hypothetical protein